MFEKQYFTITDPKLMMICKEQENISREHLKRISKLKRSIFGDLLDSYSVGTYTDGQSLSYFELDKEKHKEFSMPLPLGLKYTKSNRYFYSAGYSILPDKTKEGYKIIKAFKDAFKENLTLDLAVEYSLPFVRVERGTVASSQIFLNLSQDTILSQVPIGKLIRGKEKWAEQFEKVKEITYTELHTIFKQG